jgi:hypothetical protein
MVDLRQGKLEKEILLYGGIIIGAFIIYKWYDDKKKEENKIK